ncbi:MAG: hypothetical protein RIC55_07960 [Pirellulaceae bacterium]
MSSDNQGAFVPEQRRAVKNCAAASGYRDTPRGLESRLSPLYSAFVPPKRGDCPASASLRRCSSDNCFRRRGRMSDATRLNSSTSKVVVSSRLSPSATREDVPVPAI